MTKKMLIDATHDEETRVAVVDGYKLLEFDYESKFRKPLKGSIFLAKVTRVEPSLQAAFVNFGGNRHGFLPFSEIHPDYFRIPIADREALIAEQEEAMQEMAKREEEREESPEGGENRDAAPRHDEHAEDARESEDTIEEIRDENPVEEIGGRERGGHADEDDSDNDAEGDGENFAADDDAHDHAEEHADELNDELNDGAPSNDDHGDEGSEEAAEGHEGQAEGAPQGEEGARSEGRGGRGGRGGNGRFRGRGRGRGGRNGGGGGRGRMSHNSRRVESFGGEEYDDDGGGNDRFRFNLRRKYKIQEVIKRGQIMLVQASKEERGNKGAAVTSYLSLPGRYCVLMPNSPRGGGVSRKIASFKDRARMREIVRDLNVPQGMSVIVRTAGVARTAPEIERDLDYLMRLWDNIRELTLQSSAPAIVYEEADLIKRAVRDLYGRDIDSVIVEGKDGFETARNFMTMLVPTNEKKVVEYNEQDMPLFHKFRVEEQIAEIGESQVTLPAGGYMVINQTEALVAIDINSGRATKERHIEETALKTNLEAASEIARQLRLRDLGGLVVVDFIDMEDRRNNAKVERRMRDALSSDRARIQMGRISSFGLMELSRQRLNPSLTESQFEVCQHCKGMGRVRTCDATSIMVLRAVEDEGIRGRAKQVIAHVSNDVALYIMNNKRKNLSAMESRYGMTILIRVDENVGASSFRIETAKHAAAEGQDSFKDTFKDIRPKDIVESGEDGDVQDESGEGEQRREGSQRREFRDRGERGAGGGDREGRRRGRRGGRGRGRNRDRDRTEGGDAPNRMGPREDNGRDNSRFDQQDEPNFNTAPVNEAPVDDHYSEDPDDNRGNREEHNKSAFIERQERGRGGRGGRGRSGPDRGDRNDHGPRGGRGRGGPDRGDRPDRGERNDRGGRGRGNNGGGGGRPQQAPAEDFGNITPKREAPAFVRDEQPLVASKPAIATEQVIAPTRRDPQISSPPEDRSAEHARAFETVNEPPKQKKRGWWSKGE